MIPYNYRMTKNFYFFLFFWGIETLNTNKYAATNSQRQSELIVQMMADKINILEKYKNGQRVSFPVLCSLVMFSHLENTDRNHINVQFER